ncbi:MAG: Hsp20/alpha crystallin family protein [Fimbriimonas sp.]|jgi:HSP20 family protein|nr:Hsp20/alpha crystallin family protein [Fimbriimonas sp.]
MARRESEELFWQGGGDLAKLSEELGGLRPRVAAKRVWEPLVDLTEETDRLVLKAEIAGVSTAGVDVIYIQERNSVMIRGRRDEDTDSEQSRVGVYQLEILYGEFEREIKLPQVELNTSEMRAIFRHGLLIVLIPKAGARAMKVVVREN